MKTPSKRNWRCPSFLASNEKGKARDFAKRTFKRDAREAMKAEEQAAIKAKTDAQRKILIAWWRISSWTQINTVNWRLQALMHLLIESLFARTKIRTVQSGVRARISVAISTEAKLLSILVVLTWRTLYSLNRTQMKSSVSASVRLAIMMRSSGPRSGSRQGPAVKCIAKVDMAPHNHLSLLLLYTRYFDKWIEWSIGADSFLFESAR